MQIFLKDRYRRNGLNAGRLTAALVMSCLLVAACERPARVAAEAAIAKAADDACARDGQLTVELYGSIRASIDWQAGFLTCTGMPRPDGEGARLRMSGPVNTGDEPRTLAFILGLPQLKVGQTGNELPTNVTLIEEGTGRFFSSRDTSDCWTDVSNQDPIGTDPDHSYRIEGTLYCISPLAEVNGSNSITFTELKFIGRLYWEQPE